MTPKEKANDLVNTFFEFDFSEFLNDEECAKKCALIVVDEIIDSGAYYPIPNGYWELATDRIQMVKEYWEEVKSEIKKL